MSAMVGGNELQFASLGKKLSQARESRGWSIEQVAKATRIRPHLLRHLEGDDFTHFSHPSYLRLYLMDYARALDLPLGEIREWLPDAGSPGSENYEYITGLGSDDSGQVRKEYFYPRGNSGSIWSRVIRVVLFLAIIGLVISAYNLVRDLVRVGTAGEAAAEIPSQVESISLQQPVLVAASGTQPEKVAEVLPDQDAQYLLAPSPSIEPSELNSEVPDSKLESSPTLQPETNDPAKPEVQIDQQVNLSLPTLPPQTPPRGLNFNSQP